jgi:hypothetical protein
LEERAAAARRSMFGAEDMLNNEQGLVSSKEQSESQIGSQYACKLVFKTTLIGQEMP